MNIINKVLALTNELNRYDQMTRLSHSGQSYIMQFILFFLIGIGLFAGIGNFFRVQYELIRKDTADITIEMTNGYLSSIVVASVDSCLHCGIVENNIQIRNTTAGYFLEVLLNESGLTVSTAPPEKGHISSVNNLAYSIDFLEGSAPSIRPINLTYNRNQNKLEVK